VAGNLLCALETFQILGKLSNLTELILENEFYGLNPVCELNHYELLVLCCCNNLVVLNGRKTTPEMKVQARSALQQKQQFYESSWQTTVSLYLQKTDTLMRAINHISPSVSYLLGYIGWSEEHDKLPIPEKAISLRDNLNRWLEDSFAQISTSYFLLSVEYVKLKLQFLHLGNIDFEDIDMGCVKDLLEVIPANFVAGSVVRVIHPFELQEKDFEVSFCSDTVILLSVQGVPAYLISEAELPTVIERFNSLQFASTDYDEFKCSRKDQLYSIIQTCSTQGLTTIDLRHMGISELPTVILPKVIEVRLAFNCISDMQQVLSLFPSVVKLDVRFNKIWRLPMRRPKQLKSIDLSGNNLDLESFYVLETWMEELDEVYYDKFLIEHPSRLPDQYFLFWDVTVMTLDNSQLTDVNLLSSLRNVKRLSLRNNFLTSAGELCQLTQLEHLFLGGNRLTSIECLASLHLHVLDCACNSISIVKLNQCPRPFPRLVHLNLTKNSISSLEFIRKLSRIQEFYMGHNKLYDPAQLNHLEFHNSLLILNLYGNEVTRAIKNYRPFAIYTIPLIQILDGEPVSEDDVLHAKDLLVGCLTRAKLSEKISSKSLKDITCLDLRGCQLTRLDCFVPGECQNLAFLNLDNNLLVDVKNLYHLRGLRCLSLSSNRIESFSEPRSNSTVSIVHPINIMRIEAISEANIAVVWPHLVELYLDNNQINKLPDLFLQFLCPDVRILSLRSNRLIRLEGIEKLRSLQKMYLDQNHIRFIEPEILSGLRSLKELSLKYYFSFSCLEEYHLAACLSHCPNYLQHLLAIIG
jgi:Leucine-rich repeat (LRR) protein